MQQRKTACESLHLEEVGVKSAGLFNETHTGKETIAIDPNRSQKSVISHTTLPVSPPFPDFGRLTEAPAASNTQ